MSRSNAVLLFISALLGTASCRIYSIENPDGSYSVGLQSDSRGQTANSVVALLSKSSGYTINNNEEPETGMDEAQSRAILAPHLEILQLVETFLRFKGELGRRIRDLISDNYELIQSISNALINKIGTLHSFTLTGIRILRKLLEIASSFMSQWQVNLPGVSLDLNLGNTGSSSSFGFNKNTNLFG